MDAESSLRNKRPSRGRSVVFFLACTALFAPCVLAQDVKSEDSQGKLYRLNCAVCHGAEGRGNGRAARFLFPKPRDFSTGKTRLVSTLNRVASPSDLRVSIESGVPGTSMQPWRELGKEAVDQLVAEVLRLREQGVRERISQGTSAETDEEPVVAVALEKVIEGLTVPGKRWQAPELSSIEDASIERGRLVYRRQSCHSCHGENGEGSWRMDLVDDKGRPSWASDLRFDPLKGHGDPLWLARVIVLGMPGSAMPSSQGLNGGDLADLIRFCQSLSKEPKYRLTNHQRAQRAEGFRLPADPK